MQNLSIIANTQYFDVGDFNTQKISLEEWFKRECDLVCISSKKQCDILLKLCYSNEQSKRFVWKMCGYQIVNNLLKRKGLYSYFVMDKDGELKYKGENFRKITVEVQKDVEE